MEPSSISDLALPSRCPAEHLILIVRPSHEQKNRVRAVGALVRTGVKWLFEKVTRLDHGIARWTFSETGTDGSLGS